MKDGKAPSWDSEFLWPNPVTGPWHIKLAWRDMGDRAECVGFSVEEWDHFWRVDAPPHVITAKFVRELPIGALIQRHRELQARAAEHYADSYLAEGDYGASQDRLRYADALRIRRETSGRPRMYDDAHYRAVAGIYAEAWKAGKNPTEAVREAFTVSASTAARWVRECRSRGSLGETTKGRAGGVLPGKPDSDRKEE